MGLSVKILLDLNNLFGMVTEVRVLHAANPYIPMKVTLSGIVTEARFLQ